MQKLSCWIKSILLLLCGLAFPHAFAAGLYNDAQSISAMGNAFAGAGAAGDDASISFYNPAGLTLLEEGQLVIAGTYVNPNSILTVEAAEDSFGGVIPDSKGKQYSAAPEQIIPAIYAAAPLGESFVLGMSLTSPYALVTDYPSDSDVSNTARQTSFISYTGTLNLAMQVTEPLSLGVGANVQYFKAKLNADLSGGPLPGVISTEYTGDDVAFYPTFGVLYEFTERTRVGFSYRMHIKQVADGDFTLSFEDFPPPNSFSTPAFATFQFPDIASVHFFHQLNEKIELLADGTYTRWDRFQNITVETDTPIFGDQTPGYSEISFENTWRAGLGANYYVTPAIKLRTGLAYDQSPVTDKYRTLQGPDSDRIEAAVGFMYKPKSWEKTHLDFAYMHVFFKDGSVNQINPISAIFPDEFTGITASGTFNTSADYLGLQLVRLM